MMFCDRYWAALRFITQGALGRPFTAQSSRSKGTIVALDDVSFLKPFQCLGAERSHLAKPLGLPVFYS